MHSNPFVAQNQGSQPERLAPDLEEAPKQLHPVVVSFGVGIELVGGEVIPFRPIA